MFRDAHHYFSMVSKNVEAYSNLAADLDDGEFLTDSELFSQLRKILQERYQESRIKDLSNAQKIDIARLSSLQHGTLSQHWQEPRRALRRQRRKWL